MFSGGKENENSFYLKYKEQLKIDDKKQKIKQKYKLDDNTIIIEKSSNFFMQILSILKSGIKMVGYVALIVFISLGVTAIVNKEIREIILNYIFGG